MPMIRTVHNKENPFIQLNKAALWDKDLSLEAVGLWARLLSRPDDWEVSVAELSVSCKCNPKKVYKLLDELVSAGYAFRKQERTQSKKSNKKNVFSKWLTYVFEFKVDKKEIQKMFPHGTFRHADVPLSGKRETTNIDTKPLSNDKGLETYTKATKREGASPKSAPPPPPPDSHYVGRFEDKILITASQRSRLVEKYGGMESLVDQYAEKLYRHSLKNPKSFKKYSRHDLVIEDWIDEDLAKDKNPTKTEKKLPCTEKLNAAQLENFKKNHSLVQELIADSPNVFGGLEFYYKAHVLRDKKNPNFSVSGLIGHRDFCRVLDKHFDGTIEQAVFGNVEFS